MRGYLPAMSPLSVIGLIALAALQPATPLQEVVVSTGRLQPAEPWTQSVRATCGSSTLEIVGYGAARPLGRPPVILFDGAPLAGDTREWLSELAQPSAVYRFELLCQHTGAIYVRMNRGQKQQDGSTDYLVGDATVLAGRLVRHRPLEAANEDTFWFR
ncbi:hypothetical protein [Brevundimonas sp.]|uniref:hypothetical protein n=1 Tax=Brevundimonas sp. TaxID=1871086 RepID=UPI0037BF3871